MFETDQQYWNRVRSANSEDEQTDAAVENLRQEIADPLTILSRSKIVKTLERYHAPDHRRKGYKQLFKGDIERRDIPAERYEIVTEELITGLVTHLVAAKKELGVTDRPLKILELGAGDGQLAFHISDQLARNNPGQFTVKAVDDNSYNISSLPIVKTQEAGKALANEEPDLVIMSWPTDDWTPNIRRMESVREYILIGDPAYCGTAPGQAYGAYGRSLVYGREPDPNLLDDAPWAKDGFTHQLLEDIEQIQLGYHWNGEEGGSKTFSFRRMTPQA